MAEKKAAKKVAKKATKKAAKKKVVKKVKKIDVDLRKVPPPLPDNLDDYGEMRFLVESYYAIQEHRIKAGNRLKAIDRTLGLDPDQAGMLHDWIDDRLGTTETDLKKAIEQRLKNYPLWSDYLKKVSGVGPCLAGGLIAWVAGPHYSALSKAEAEAGVQKGWEIVEQTLGEDSVGEYTPFGEGPKKGEKSYYRVRHGIAAFDTPSAFWTYCGVGLRKDGTVQRRIKGERGNWRPQLKQLAWKAGESFVRSGKGYRELYLQKKEQLQKRPIEEISLDANERFLTGRLCTQEIEGVCKVDDIVTKVMLEKARKKGVEKMWLGWRPAHIDRMARRWTSKIFLSHVWYRWRQMENLPIRLPYAIEYGGHTTEIPVVEE